MKATGLRIVIGIAVGALLAAGTLASSPSAYADEAALKAALDDYSAGRYEDALKKLTDYVATTPGDDEVYNVLRTAQEKVLLRALAQGGDHERLMRYLLDKAKPVVEAKKRDPEAIKALVEDAINGDFDAQRRACMQLAAKHGDYAVPYLLPALGDSDPKKVTAAIFAFHYIGAEAVLPLSAAMNTSDARLRGYVAVVLGDIKDPRALPVLRRAAERDADEGVKAKAAASITKIRADAAAMSAAESYVRTGQRYYENDPATISEADQVYNLWRWESDALARYEVPGSLFNYAIAEAHAWDALALQPDLASARSLLVRSVVSQMLQGNAMGDKAPEALKGAWDLLVSQGFDAASAGLADALDQRDWAVAVECCRLCGATYGKQDLAGHPLGRALAAPERRVQYAAAVAALRMSPAAAFDNSGNVPALAAQAASETALRQVFVIDDHDDARGRLMADLREAGFIVGDDSDGYRGVARLKGTATADVVIVRAELGSAGEIPMHQWRSTLAVLDEMGRDLRLKNMRVVLVLGGSADEITAKKSFLQGKYGEAIKGFIEEPLVTTAYLPIVEQAAAAGDLNPDRAAALVVAADAADALAATDPCCTAWDFKVAIDPLSNNAVEGATDDVKMNAVRALGNLKGGGAAALAKVLGTADAKEELRVAAAKSLGAVLSRVQGTPDEIDALVQAAKGGGAVGSAAMQALGMVKGLPPETARGVYGDHRILLGNKGE